MFSLENLKKELLKHYRNPNRKNQYQKQLAIEHEVPLEFVRQVNWELLQERKIEFKDITG